MWLLLPMVSLLATQGLSVLHTPPAALSARTSQQNWQSVLSTRTQRASPAGQAPSRYQ